MTSEVWVWAYLPGDGAPTLAGRFLHESRPGGLAIGKFVYGKSYLGNVDALALDPLQLKLADRTYETAQLQGYFGPLRDAMPDDWGRYVIDLRHGKQDSLTGYLLLAEDDRIGNLAFTRARDQEPQPSKFAGTGALEVARDLLKGIEAGRPIDEAIADWVRPSTAMGGARPKLTIEHEGKLWIAKFPARNDTGLPVAKLEAAMLKLASLCGIRSVNAKVVHDDILLVERFDRKALPVDGSDRKWRRDAYVSARTLFHADPVVQASAAETGSYPRLAKELGRCSEAIADDRRELFRRMVFNACVSNTDDHDRNHGLLAGDQPGQYRLSPAFDIVPRVHHTKRRYQALIVGNAGALCTRENLLSSCGDFGLAPREASDIFEEIQATVLDRWKQVLQDQGASAAEIQALSPCFAPVLPSLDEPVDPVPVRRRATKKPK